MACFLGNAFGELDATSTRMDTLRCRVLSPSLADEQLETSSLENVIHILCNLPAGSANLVEFYVRPQVSRLRGESRRVFAAWAFPVKDSVSTSLQEALDELEDWLEHGNGQDFMMLCDIKHSGITVLATFLICLKEAEVSFTASTSSLRSSIWDCEKPDKSHTGGILNSWRILQAADHPLRLSRWCTLPSIFSLILILLLATSITVTSLFMAKPVQAYHPQYPQLKQTEEHLSRLEAHLHALQATATTTSPPPPQSTSPEATRTSQWVIPNGNIGPTNQEYLLPSNLTTFTSTHNVTQDFILRLDDQALMPAPLVDHHELKVQAWFAANFPLLASVRNSGNYLNSSFLDYSGSSSGPERLLLDERYHIAHCTTAFRRYLRAVMEGRHVCPRDLDLGHLDHCTRQLESFAYRSREEWDAVVGVERVEDRLMRHGEELDPSSRQVMLVWHTDVCF